MSVDQSSVDQSSVDQSSVDQSSVDRSSIATATPAVPPAATPVPVPAAVSLVREIVTVTFHDALSPVTMRLVSGEVMDRVSGQRSDSADQAEEDLIVAWARQTIQTVAPRAGRPVRSFDIVKALVSDPIPDGRGRTLKVLPRILSESGRYFVGGVVRTLDEVIEADLREEDWLITWMKDAQAWAVITHPDEERSRAMPTHFKPADRVIDEAGRVVVRGDDPRFTPRFAVLRFEALRFEEEG